MVPVSRTSCRGALRIRRHARRGLRVSRTSSICARLGATGTATKAGAPSTLAAASYARWQGCGPHSSHELRRRSDTGTTRQGCCARECQETAERRKEAPLVGPLVRQHPPPHDRITSVNAAERKAARARWESRVFDGDWEEMADYDALFWDRIPVDERAEAVWQVSRELYEVAQPGSNERRLPRSAFRLERR